MVKSQISSLIKLAIRDNDLGLQEQKWIYKIGENSGLSTDEISNLFKHPVELSDSETLTSDEKFQYLYNVVQLMKIDRKVFKSEIHYCEELAEKLGYKKNVIGLMSTMIFSNPSITADREMMKNKVQKYAVY